MNIEKIYINEMLEQEENRVMELVTAGFNEFVKQDLTEEGKAEFFRAAHSLIHDRPNKHFILVAHLENVIIGMISVRDSKHICLFFVDKKFHNKGVGRILLEKAISKCIAQLPQIKSIDVNSSIFAVNAYINLGFVKRKEEQVVNGIRFVPMVRYFEKA